MMSQFVLRITLFQGDDIVKYNHSHLKLCLKKLNRNFECLKKKKKDIQFVISWLLNLTLTSLLNVQFI